MAAGNGWLPPMSDAAWQASCRNIFPRRREDWSTVVFSGGRIQADFWLEFTHRLWGG